MNKIYVIEGQTGEYSDSQHWLVAAYTDRSRAEAEVVRLTMLAKVAERFMGDSDSEEWRVAKGAAKAADPQFQCDFSGTIYSVLPLNLVNEINNSSEGL